MNKTLQDKLKSYDESYWNFEQFQREGIHKIANYPAMMVAPMQYKLIDDVIKYEENIVNIFDPFHGSGTTLVEGYKLGLNVVGIDINPLANLITKVKLQGINKNTINEEIEMLIKNIKETEETKSYKLHYFEKIDKWFREDVINDLSIIRHSINLEKNKITREYYWTCMSNLVRKYSNTRNSTFKLHVKEKEKINNMDNNIIKDFISTVQKNISFFNMDDNKNISKLLIQGDSLLEMNKIEDESIDLICTSPPYGDNGTTVTYGQYSILSLLWINSKDITVNDEQLMKNFSSIDTLSLGGTKNPIISKIENFPSETLMGILKHISTDKQKKVKNFFYDYFNIISEMIRVLKEGHLMILTLGNRRVDNQEIKLDQITKEYCINNGMNFEVEFIRDIKRKKIPNMVSNVSDFGPVKSMSKETILILRKEFSK